jgi:L-iditol 2-dehydrogenase
VFRNIRAHVLKYSEALMKALVYTAPRTLELQELAAPEIRSSEVRVKVRAAAVCGSDLHGFLGRSKKRVPPLVLGHEFSGEVADSSDVAFTRGDAVAVYPIISCGACRYCAGDRENLCPSKRVYGLDIHGGLAEYVGAPARCLFRLPAGMSFLEGSLVEPLANAVHVLKRCPDVRGQSGLIYGAGPIGMLCALVARHFGAARLAVVHRNPHRLSKMHQLGADLVINASAEDPVRTILEWTAGNGVDFSIDAVGNTACRENSIASTAAGGTAVCIGLEEEVCAADTRPLVTREVDLKGSYAYTRADFADAIELLQRKLLPWETFVTKAQLAQGQAIVDDLATGSSAIMKAVFEI